MKKISSQNKPDSSQPKRDSRVTIREIAAETGFSKSLVALAIKNDRRVAEATRKKIIGVARRMGYHENPVVAYLMFHLRKSRNKAYQANLAFINCSRSQDTIRWHTNSEFRKGFFAAAARHGYGVDDFWLNQPDRSYRQLARILRSRRIAGLALVAARDLNTIQKSYDDIWYDFPVIGIGIARTVPPISCVCTDHFQTAMAATEELLRRGYRKPGLFVKQRLNQLVDKRFSGGFLSATQHLDSSCRAEIYLKEDADKESFRRWLRSEKPDCILTLHAEVLSWLGEMGKAIPASMGLVHLDWNEKISGWAGMIQNSHRVGETAAELVIQNIHGNQRGAPADSRVIMIESHWRDGKSVLPAAKPL